MFKCVAFVYVCNIFIGLLCAINALPECQKSITSYNNGQQPCKGELIFSDDFSSSDIDADKWLVEQYSPANSEDREFVSYRKDKDVVFIEDSRLHLKPIAFKNRADLRGVLDLTNGCTRTGNQCMQHQLALNLLPPAKSGRVRSKVSFKYGKIEIEAKLPKGDWIFPMVSLYPKNGADVPRVLIAYARGNDHVYDDYIDVGSRLLYGGDVFNSSFRVRGQHLKSLSNSAPWSDDYHTFTLLWEPGVRSVSVDGKALNPLNPVRELMRDDSFEDEFFITLGVGVGGVNDFPDDPQNIKPWRNADVKLLLSFFRGMDTWAPSWVGNDVALKVQSVKVWAL